MFGKSITTFLLMMAFLFLGCSENASYEIGAKAMNNQSSDTKKQSLPFAKGGDSPTKEIAIERERADYRAQFQRFSGEGPTLSALSQSLRHENAKGEIAIQVVAALNLIALGEFDEQSDAKKQGLVSDILLCFVRNPENWTVKNSCVPALLRVNKEYGVEIGRHILNSPKSELEAKLLTATYMIKHGLLDGYSVIRAGLTSENKIARQLATDLVESFRPYDGKTDEQSGQSIDIDALLMDIKQQ